MSTFFNDIKFGIRMLRKYPGFTFVTVLILSMGISVSIGIGLAVSWGLTRILRSLLFGITPTDPATFVCAALLLTAVALLASYIPARRAAKTDPMEALRYE